MSTAISTLTNPSTVRSSPPASAAFVVPAISDDELLAAVVRLAGRSRETTASLIAHLVELHGRRLHEREGFSSLFEYCTGVLRFSDGEAYDRMKAVKVARRYPAVLPLLGSGRLTLTAVRLLAPHLTRSNHAELFAAAEGKRKRQVQELLAARFPKPDVASSVRKLPTRAAVTEGGGQLLPGTDLAGGDRPVVAASLPPTADDAAPPVPAPCPVPEVRRPLVLPLSATDTGSRSRHRRTHGSCWSSPRTCSVTRFRPATPARSLRAHSRSW